MKLSAGEAGIAAVMGYAVVFIGLVLLMVVVLIMGRIMVSRRKAAQARASTVKPAIAPAAPAALPAAPGSAGEIKLHSVPDKEAAMVMAIVANKLQRPLNELRFKSIKEVK